MLFMQNKLLPFLSLLALAGCSTMQSAGVPYPGGSGDVVVVDDDDDRDRDSERRRYGRSA
jgi:hypothetical protein